jgi:hypothetical protein
MVLNATFNNISVMSWWSRLSFIGGGNWSTWKKPHHDHMVVGFTTTYEISAYYH